MADLANFRGEERNLLEYRRRRLKYKIVIKSFKNLELLLRELIFRVQYSNMAIARDLYIYIYVVQI